MSDRKGIWLFILLLTIHSALAAPPSAVVQAEMDKAFARDDTLKELLEGRPHARWTKIPSWIRDIYISPDRKSYFMAEEISRADTADSIQWSVERISAGKSSVLHGGHLLMADRLGRFFVRSTAAGQDVLYCYDPRTKQMTLRYPGGDKPSKSPGFYPFMDHAWLDSTGAAWFIGGGKISGWFISRCGADGVWSSWRIIEDWNDNDFPMRHPALIEQDDGCFVLFETREFQTGAPAALRFDGKQWTTLNPRVCTTDDLKVICPNHDGSISVICGQGRLWTYWPQDVLDRAGKLVGKLIQDLGDLDPQVRESSQQKLAMMGEFAVGPMTNALGLSNPGIQARLQMLIPLAAQFEADRRNDPHDSKLPYAGEWLYERAYICSRNVQGKVALYLQHIKNIFTNQESEIGIALVNEDGSWDVHMVDSDQWTRSGLRWILEDVFADSKGRIWTQDGMRRIDPDMRMQVLPPPGMELRGILGENTNGNYLVSGANGNYLFDESVPLAVSAVEEKIVPLLGPRAVRGDSVPIALDPADQGTLYWLRDGETHRIPPNWEKGSLLVWPMRQGTAIVAAGPWSIWDGTQWLEADDDEKLVQQNFNWIQKHAGRTLTGGPPNLRIAADEQGHVWLQREFYDNSDPDPALQKHIDELRYFDGLKWHDVRSELKVLGYEGIIIRCVENGKNLLLRQGKELLIIGYRNANLFVNIVKEQANSSTVVSAFVDSPSGETWAMHDLKLVVFRDGQMSNHDDRIRPTMVDSQRRLWGLEYTATQAKLVVQVAGHWKSSTFSGIDSATQMIQTPDERIWALHSEGLSQIRLSEETDGTLIKEAGRWLWNSPRTTFDNLCFDGSSYLWFSGSATNCVRLTLPKP